MRISDLPSDILERIFDELPYAALGRIVSTRTVLAPVAGRVASRRVQDDAVLARNATWLKCHGIEAECCWECLAPGLGYGKFCYRRENDYIQVCTACTKDSGGFRELLPTRTAKNVAKDKFAQAGLKSAAKKADFVVLTCQYVPVGKGYCVWACEFKRRLREYECMWKD